MCKFSFKQIYRLSIIFPIIILISCIQEKPAGITSEEAVTRIKLSESQKQLSNIKSSTVTEGVIGPQLTFTGVLKVDEQSSVTISSRVAGRIEKLFFKNTGEEVKVGDALFEFYSEELWNAEREFISLQQYQRNFSSRYEPLIASENKLLLLGLTPSQIDQIRKEGKILYVVTIYSTVSGIIRSVNITEGQYVTNGQSLFELADDKRLWVEAQVYPDDLQHLEVGMPVEINIPVAEGLRIQNRITYINPVFEPGKNVTLIRAMIENPDKKLYPGMLAMISVRTQLSRGIVVPSEAVLNDRKGSKVILQLEDGSFTARKVVTGTYSSDSVQILEGLRTSDIIVTKGVYLLNSEMILNKTIEEPEEAGVY